MQQRAEEHIGRGAVDEAAGYQGVIFRPGIINKQGSTELRLKNFPQITIRNEKHVIHGQSKMYDRREGKARYTR